MVSRVITAVVLIALPGPGAALRGDPANREDISQVARGFVSTRIRGPNLSAQHTLPPELSIKDIRGESGQTLAYFVPLQPAGFIIVAADKDHPPILGYSSWGRVPVDGDRPHPLTTLVRWDVEGRMRFIRSQSTSVAAYSSTNQGRWAEFLPAAQSASASFSVQSASPPSDQCPDREPLLQTHWHQGNDWPLDMCEFNCKCPIDPKTGDSRSVVGCTATAMAQILNYWKYPPGTRLTPSDRYVFARCLVGLSIVPYWIDDDAIQLDFPDFDEINDALASIDYSNQPGGDTEYLNFAVGIKLQSTYSSGGTGAYQSALAYLRGFDYGSARSMHRGLDLDFYGKIKRNLEQTPGQPVQLSIFGASLLPPRLDKHSLVVDGYCPSSGEYHLNLGAGDIGSDVWYHLPDDLPDIPAFADMFSHVASAVYDICPYQGWSQYSADARNSFRCHYSAPTVLETLPKWQYTCPGTHSFEGLVVGTGGKVYASCSPVNIGMSDHPSVWVINAYGELEKTIPLNAENSRIRYPVQNQYGDVFVASEAGRVYRIDPKNNMATLIFTVSSGEEITTPLKVDEDGWVYICTQAKLYRIGRYGTVRWVFNARHSGTIRHGLPAIDTENGAVYVSYHDGVGQSSYLASVDLTSGTLRWEKPFADVPDAYKSTGVAAVGNDGVVYVGCRAILYAISRINGATVWQKGLSTSAIVEAPAIGYNGTLYLGYWKTVGGTDRLVLGAVDPANGAVKWEYPCDAGSLDSIKQTYVAGDGLVLFTLQHYAQGADSFEVYCLRDIEDHAELVWRRDYGADGGHLAFGPGATVYIIPGSGYGDTIYAVSEGAVGQPDEAGMAFTNNSGPAAPFAPTPADASSSVDPRNVTLSWACNDPEGHAIKYDVYLSEATGLMFPVGTRLSTTSYSVGNLLGGQEYVWRVVATDGQAITEGPVWSFRTLPDADADGDGVPDVSDLCPNTVPNSPVDASGCPPFIPGDFDHDGDVDSIDFDSFEACASGPGIPQNNTSCAGAKLDSDDDVDQSDFASFQLCYSGFDTPADPTCLGGTPLPDMVFIPAGEFQMGNALSATGDGWESELPVHTVYLDAFYIGAYEVTKGLWDTVNVWATANGYDLTGVGSGKAANHPVTNVNWYDCVKWCNARSQKEGRTPCYYSDSGLTVIYKTGELAPYVKWDANGYRLPTEAEWEKAARGGVGGHRFPWSDSDEIQHARANYYSDASYSYDTSPTRGYHPDFDDPPSPYTSPVGHFAPNGYGLYDMTGNVWERCNDWYGDDYYSSCPEGCTNPQGPSSGTGRVFRGTSFAGHAGYCRVAYRGANLPGNRHYDVGFRLVIGSPPPGMVLIPAGEFQMGNALSATGDGWESELPVHTVYLDAFYIGAYEVTKGLWDTVNAWATANGYDLAGVGSGKAANHPLTDVNWYDCVKWCNARSQKEGRTPCYYSDSGLTVIYKTGELAPYVKCDANGYRLPTEAEWEKAARGGAVGHRFPWSDSDEIQHARANYYSDASYSYDTSPTRGYHPDFDDPPSPYTSPVGHFAPNGYGLYDMTGNVWERCNDWYGDDYYSSCPEGCTNPQGPSSGTGRVFRGTSFAGHAGYCRVAYRGANLPGNRHYDVGFRLALSSRCGF